MIIKIFFVLLCSIFLDYQITFAQSDNFGPGYDWNLFRNSSSWNLALAVSNDDTAKILEIIKFEHPDINFQEQKFGRTLLMLAVGNDKLLSTELLLKMGADPHIRDSSGGQAIHDAVHFVSLKKNAFKILQLLIQFHADVNSICQQCTITVPLEDGVGDFQCAKLLLASGANVYFRNKEGTYTVWYSLFINDIKEGILFAKHIVVDKKMLIPDPITYYNGKPIGIYYWLNKTRYQRSDKIQARDEIIYYLKSIKFPLKGKYG